MRLARCRTGRDAFFLCGGYKSEAMWWACGASRSRVPRAPKCCAWRRPLSGPPATRPCGGIPRSTSPSGRSLCPGLGALQTGSPASVRHGGAPASCQRRAKPGLPRPTLELSPALGLLPRGGSCEEAGNRGRRHPQPHLRPFSFLSGTLENLPDWQKLSLRLLFLKQFVWNLLCSPKGVGFQRLSQKEADRLVRPPDPPPSLPGGQAAGSPGHFICRG